MAENYIPYLTVLHELLNQHYSMAETRTLCLHLNIDYEALAGEEKPSRIRELLLLLKREGRIPDLIARIQHERPFVDWPQLPGDEKNKVTENTTNRDVPIMMDSTDYKTKGDIHLQYEKAQKLKEIRVNNDIESWVNILSNSSSLQNRDTWQAVIAELPMQIRNNLNINLPTLNTRLRDLVRKCQNYEDGLLSLVEAIRKLEGNSFCVQELEALL